jgi:hypothetical protein
MGGSDHSRYEGRSNDGTRYAKSYHFMKFSPQVEGKPPPPTFASVKGAIVLQFKKESRIDIAVSLDNMKLMSIPEPIRKISTATDPNDKREEQVGLDMIFKSDRDSWKARMERLNDGLVSAYATIMTDYCTKLMRDRIEEHPEFESKILNDPIELLLAIKVLIHAPKRAQYPLLDWVNTLKRFINLRQDPNETLSDYYKRFSQEYDTFKALFGTHMFDHAAEHLQEYLDGDATSTRLWTMSYH